MAPQTLAMGWSQGVRQALDDGDGGGEPEVLQLLPQAGAAGFFDRNILLHLFEGLDIFRIARFAQAGDQPATVSRRTSLSKRLAVFA